MVFSVTVCEQEVVTMVMGISILEVWSHFGLMDSFQLEGLVTSAAPAL